MQVHIKSRYVDSDVELKFGTYQNGSIAITAHNLKTDEPIFRATVAFATATPAPGHVFLKLGTENEVIPEALIKAGIVQRCVPPRFVAGPYDKRYAEEFLLLVEIPE